MQASQTREIDGMTFEVSQLDVKVSRAVFVRLTKLLGPALGELGKAISAAGSTSILDLDHTAVLPAMAQLVACMSEEELEFLVQAFMKKSKFTPPEGTGQLIPLVDIAFTGRLLTMFKWLAFAIEVNYADFFAVFKTIKLPTSRSEKTPSPSSSPQT
jgi:tail assembly chaperone